MMEFHVSREARDKYRFDEALFSFTGNVVFANLAASREFAHRMNVVRGVEQDPKRAVHPGALYAMGLIDELSHALVEFYRRQLDPPVITEAMGWVETRLGRVALDNTLFTFVEEFPGSDLYKKAQQGKEGTRAWLQDETDGVAHRAIAFEEMLLLWLANANPAFAGFSELFQDERLTAQSKYREIIPELHAFLKTRPPIGPENLSLIEMLREPALVSPDSLSGQLGFIRKKWVTVLGEVVERLVLAMDILKEEDLAIWMRFHPPSAGTRPRWGHEMEGARGFSQAPTYSDAGQEYERFSQDQDWMPSTVLLAKSSFVWLEQLSRQYRRHIHRLDQIPDEELALMARRGLNALWLIGVWERSTASQTIKQLCGNQEAVASAYSLYGYSIAADLGGESAYENLRDRAMKHGIRLASDMVPNHMGIDSSWVIQHPEWFLSRSDSPYPAYRFEGPDLSRDDRVEIKIEDHYYEQSDAAVVFRRRDKWTGDIRYIYHGNDGTSFPWNDTAQLNYLNPATREQVIQTILGVARLFPIIRFDAAMTLAKRHFQRLWFPLPGTAGAIPSRAEFGMSKAQFDAAMPEEFWREVVDRVAREVPGTLLLAEAFWLMEGYFVRTLGMHRVYNSAFMNMMRDEENAKYRSVIKNTLEFDPDILKRYVNFMSNPDERTAIDQFGKEDKYFGVATLMATLPGLPMFGHGQIEGFTEKYGMEFRKPRYEEHPDRWQVERHDREIAPLLHRRWLFAESQNFLLYDFYRPDGTVDENVFAYSNRRGDQSALVIYHNRYATTYGTIHHSAAYADKASGAQRQRSIGEAFGLQSGTNLILAFRDTATGLEHLERAATIADRGFSMELHAYQRHIYLDWRQLWPDENHRWDRLCEFLNGRGVKSVEESLLSLELTPVHDSLVALLKPDLLHSMASLSTSSSMIAGCREPASNDTVAAFFHKLEKDSTRFFEEAGRYYARRILGQTAAQADPEVMWLTLCELVRAAIRLPSLETAFVSSWSAQVREVLPSSSPKVAATAIWGPVLAWCVLRAFAAGFNSEDPPSVALRAFDELRLREAMARAFGHLEFHGEETWQAAARVRIAFQAEASSPERIAGYPRQLWEEPDVRWLIHLHEASGKEGEVRGEYFNRELHEQLLWWIQLPVLVENAREILATVPSESSSSRTEPNRVTPSQIPTARTDLTAENLRTRVQSPVEALESQIKRGLDEAKEAGYCIGELLQPGTPEHQRSVSVSGGGPTVE